MHRASGVCNTPLRIHRGAPAGTDGSAPFAANSDTTNVSDGLYDVRAVATDNAGNTNASTVTNRRVDNTAPDTTLDSKKKAMAAEEAKLREQMERYQRLIENAPKLAKERERRQREQFVTRASRADHRPGSRAALPDRRYELNPGAPARQRRLRAERNQGRMMFFILLLIFVAVVGWVYLTMGR